MHVSHAGVQQEHPQTTLYKRLRRALDVGIEGAQGGVVLQQVGRLLHTTCVAQAASEHAWERELLVCMPIKSHQAYAPESLMTTMFRLVVFLPSTHRRKLRPAIAHTRCQGRSSPSLDDQVLPGHRTCKSYVVAHQCGRSR